MSEAFPNPYDPPETHAAPPPPRAEDEEEELSRALRESLAFEAQERERVARQEQEALQAAIAASQDEARQEQEALRAAIAASQNEEKQRREREQQSLLQERQALEQSTQEARRREAEHQRQALLEMEVLQQSRREHEAQMRYRQSLSFSPPSRRGTADLGAEESLLWLGAPTSGRSTPRTGTASPPPIASSSGRRREMDTAPLGPPPAAVRAPLSSTLLGSTGLESEPAPRVASSEPTSSGSSIESEHSDISLTLPPPPQSRYEAALAAAEAEYDPRTSEHAWGTDTDADADAASFGARTPSTASDTLPNPFNAPHPAPAYDEEDEAHAVPIMPLQPQRYPGQRTPPPPGMLAAASAAQEHSAAYTLDDQPWAAAHPVPMSPTPDEAPEPSWTQPASPSRGTPSAMERQASGVGVPYPEEHANGQPALRGVQFGFAATPYDLSLYATPCAPAPLYARPDLSLEPHLPMDRMAQPEQRLQLFFPERITLRDEEEEKRPWFVMRAYSWKVLLQALAWYGHATLASGTPDARMQPELAFCMPRRADGPHDTVPTFVVLALRLAVHGPHRVGAPQVLETYAARLGACITTVSLAQHTLALPTDLVTLAQTLFSAPQLSSAPALRELRQVIARQDEWLETRRAEIAQRVRMHAGDPGAPVDRAESLEWSMLHHQLSLLQHPGALPADPATEAPSGHREHLRQRMKKKLARWGGAAPDQDLSAWITPYDLAQHGGPSSPRSPDTPSDAPRP